MKRNERNSRRDQVLLLLLVITSVVLIVLDFRRDEESPLDGLRTGAATVFGPLEEVVARAAGAVGDAAQRVAGDGSAASAGKTSSSRLAAENAELRRRLRTTELARNRADQLDRLLRVAAAGQYRTVPAQVVARPTAQSLGRTITIDAGSRDGIESNMTVINGDGLVGRVRTVGPWTATVLLILDAESAVGVRLERSMEVGIVSGRGAGALSELTLQLLDSQAKVGPGQRLVTLGSQRNRPYVPGVPVGVVKQVRPRPGTITRSATVDPYVDFSTLDLVGVVIEPPRRNPRDAVLPPLPTSSGEPSVAPSGRDG